ncbi:tpr repeat-containing protein : Family description./TPR repeat OS=Chthonomonas calidirosea (strain DSM 23976 / ICMP 18418 / T49) GN=CCALI_02286 PE=4 SV=1: TPR_9: VCBS [Gemmata massiliana]|uniref:ASPIC/UnbV domain-containing protein n=1 Tax=Gemmata massiliana TaxID=1210884 RepID=A0A6P2D2S6_9BACT|nr:CRTAC1 family protein [Gemmata massiliana]VTR95628.1 tpr repeat-containing protein : Family description./TPR repeat OS=Chthonomonas calidirosea (strain DSM 23976 / ICMP 18418 / T49) GN=CCALI_02286 PE=4 SV=1: TPR_9: VCBS [Gemmata massiliana]
MASYLHRHRSKLIAAVVVLLVAAGATAFFVWKRQTRLPNPGEPAYEQFVESFELGSAALDVDVWDVAETNLNKAVELVPQEPAARANRALLNFRTARLPEAERDLKEAERLAPDDPDIAKLRGVLEERGGRYTEAIASLRKATEKDRDDIQALFFLAQTIIKEQKPDSDAEYQRLLEQILAARPNNRYARLELLRAAVRRADRTAVKDVTARLKAEAPSWTFEGGDKIRAAFEEWEKASTGPLDDNALFALTPFANLYLAAPGYAQDATDINPRGGYRGYPLRTFLRLAPVRPSLAPADTELTFTTDALENAPAGRWTTAVPVWLTGEGNPVVFLAGASEVRRVGAPAALPALPAAPDGLVALDWNNDFRTDLFVASPKGVQFYEQGADGNFTEVTAKTKLPADILKGDFAAVLAADVDLDGDLDLLLARQTGAPVLLRNNLDGTFTAQPIFPEVDSGRAFAWADLDHDGAADAVVLDARGRLHVFANERSGVFKRWPVALPDAQYLTVNISDADDDGTFDLIALRADGAILRISDRNKRASWDVAELARWDNLAGAEPGSVRLLVADLDNNGAPDLIASRASGSAAWLGSGNGKFERLSATLPPNIVVTADLTGTGRLDLLALDANGSPTRSRNVGKKEYHWQCIRFRAAPGPAEGDNRINSFGICGEIEFRTGTHVVKRPITGPVSHFGLGTRTKCDVLRIQWPNGTPQIEFARAIDQTVVAEQRLKGSCPFLFTWNGERFVFVTDFMWSTPLGMYINAQNKGGFLQTTEWVKIRGDQLVPRDGHYEVRVNANLWETHYFDHLSLRLIDHPLGTELYVDERFALEPSKPAFHLTQPTRPVAQAWDHRGADVTSVVRAVDGEYLDRAGRGLYQGITNDHWVEVDLGADAPREGPVWLVAHGWIHPTDSSVNYALEQGQNTRPRALTLEVPDGKGGWKVARDKIGFPAGKNKSVLLRLDGLDGPGVARRFRLRTNMEIYWDALHYARGAGGDQITEKELHPTVADLRFRGIVAMTQANRSSPELPHYDQLVAEGQPWRDLIGYHTRFGDIRELLAKTDDRYAILTAGDEIVLRFAAQPDPPQGWKRDFVWVSDGWVKDGDLNTRFGKTVLPLPAHNMASYDVPPTTLENDPVYRRFRKDWDVFHTRYVTPDQYERGLRNFKRRGEQP